jgi:hypothetical protein
VGAPFAPRGDGLRHLRLLASHPGRALDLPPRGLGIGTPVGGQPQLVALARRPRLAAQLAQTMIELDGEREQVLDVGGGVLAYRR